MGGIARFNKQYSRPVAINHKWINIKQQHIATSSVVCFRVHGDMTFPVSIVAGFCLRGRRYLSIFGCCCHCTSPDGIAVVFWVRLRHAYYNRSNSCRKHPVIGFTLYVFSLSLSLPHPSTYLSIYLPVCVCVCVCFCMQARVLSTYLGNSLAERVADL